MGWFGACVQGHVRVVSGSCFGCNVPACWQLIFLPRRAFGHIIGSGAVMSVCRGSVRFVCRLYCQGASEAVGLQHVEHSCMSVRKKKKWRRYRSALCALFLSLNASNSRTVRNMTVSAIQFLCNISLLNLQSRPLIPLALQEWDTFYFYNENFQMKVNGDELARYRVVMHATSEYDGV